MASSNSSIIAINGIGLGTLIAVLISWKINASVGWCIIHGLLGWIYIIYWFIFIGAV